MDQRILNQKAPAMNRPTQKSDEVQSHWSHGHYYSPVVNPDASVNSYWSREMLVKPDGIEGIDLNLPCMIEFWSANAEYLLANPFPDEPGEKTRYHALNGTFPGGDAMFVGAMMRTYRPERIIEIGSGNSTACMLDWAERLDFKDLKITCVEPDPIRLKRNLRSADKVQIIESMVQDVDLSIFDDLRPNDVLFIDSTHVLKTGSDVHFELFHILPRLADGVIIHFHDCAYPFEYSKKAVFELNFSWNEAYALRAFLMYNSAFRVIFWNSMFYRFCPPQMRAAFATLSQNPGGGLWIRKGSAAEAC
jgi:hypothetical protein